MPALAALGVPPAAAIARYKNQGACRTDPPPTHTSANPDMQPAHHLCRVCALAGASVGSYHDLRRGLQAELADWAATRYRGELLEGVLRGMREDIEEYESTPRNRAHLSEPGEGAPGAAGAEAEEEPAVAAQA